MTVFESPIGPDIRACLEEARDMLYAQRIPNVILEAVLAAWLAIGDAEITEAEADGLLWGFVAGRVYADSMRLAPEYYAHMPNLQ